jgi:hypothetical protein
MGKQVSNLMRNRVHMYKKVSRRPVKVGSKARRDLHSQKTNPYIHASQAVRYSR